MSDTPPSGLRPISTFDPTQPALLHDRRNDKIIPWTGEDADRWNQEAREHGEGVIEWDGHLIDGWANPLGG